MSIPTLGDVDDLAAARLVSVLLEVVDATYRLATMHYDACYTRLLRPKLTDFLIVERKRFSKRNERQTRHDENNNDHPNDDDE